MKPRKRIDYKAVKRQLEVRVINTLNPALHLLHNGKSVMPGSREHELLMDLWRACD